MQAITCGTKDKAGCDKNNECKWQKQYSCDGKGTLKTSDQCDYGYGDEMMAGLTKEIFGAKLGAQSKKCQAAKAQAACDDVADGLSMGAGKCEKIGYKDCAKASCSWDGGECKAKGQYRPHAAHAHIYDLWMYNAPLFPLIVSSGHAPYRWRAAIQAFLRAPQVAARRPRNHACARRL